MNPRSIVLLTILAALGLTRAAGAYPGGTPSFQTDVAPFCAACHSSVQESALEGAGERATAELTERKHLAAILSGSKGYAELSEAERVQLVEHIRALDANSSVELDFPPQVVAGENFQVTVQVTGGAGPVVGVALVDRPHRWFARPASAAGWSVVGAPTVIGQDGLPQTQWLSSRPESAGRGITFVNITGISSDAIAGKWAKAKVIFTLRAPDEPGDYPLVATYFYGSEKASALGFTEHPVYGKQPRGGFAGNSGRVIFTPARVITVNAAPAESP